MEKKTKISRITLYVLVHKRFNLVQKMSITRQEIAECMNSKPKAGHLAFHRKYYAAHPVLDYLCLFSFLIRDMVHFLHIFWGVCTIILL